jgi:hypothetical protein
VEAKVAAFDILNIKLLFSDDSLASFNEDVAEELKKKKHPSPSREYIITISPCRLYLKRFCKLICYSRLGCRLVRKQQRFVRKNNVLGTCNKIVIWITSPENVLRVLVLPAAARRLGYTIPLTLAKYHFLITQLFCYTYIHSGSI